jgi:PAS domain S-box-containing protein/diguanylate cyclase (GGDEF)-like protein
MKKSIGCFLPEFPVDGNLKGSKGLKSRLADALSVTTNEIDQGVVIADARDSDLRVVYANRAFEVITGYASSYAVGRNCRHLQRDERDQPEIQKIRQAIAARAPVSVTIRNYRKDGTPFWNGLRLLPVFSEAHELTCYVGLMREVSVAPSLSDANSCGRHIDPLTGLRDRYDLVRHIDNLTASGQTCYLLMVKLDVVRFRDVNSRLGIALGDALLQQIARRLASLQADVTARVDADEFVIAQRLDRREAVDGWLSKIGSSLRQKYFLAGIETKAEFCAGYLIVDLATKQGSLEAGMFSL